MSSTANDDALRAFVELVVSDPPAQAADCDLALAPLFQQRSLPVGALFPALWEALGHPQMAAQVLDLSNFVTRRGFVAEHPGRGRTKPLGELLAGVVKHLEELRQSPQDYADSPERLRQTLGECVALIVALCDALALIGDTSAAARLRQAMELPHRRIRTEAAAALARLGDSNGVDVLVAMVTEPVVRCRALAYLDELGLADRVEAQWRTPQAKAEGEFVQWLADPIRFGVAPYETLLVDHTRQRWPGSSEPVDCFLFHFEYQLPRGVIEGVGIAGPVTHVLNVDLEYLPPPDIYAAYAGWSAQHLALGHALAEKRREEFTPEELEHTNAIRRELTEIGYDEAKVVKLGRVFDDVATVATAQVAGQPGTVVAESDELTWFPAGSGRRPLGPDEAYYIYLGRKLLRGSTPDGRGSRTPLQPCATFCNPGLKRAFSRSTPANVNRDPLVASRHFA